MYPEDETGFVDENALEHTVLSEFRIIGGKINFPHIIGRETQRSSHRLRIDAVRTLAGREVLIGSSCVKREARDPRRQFILDDWGAHRPLELPAAQPAQFSKKISIELVGGLSGDDVDDAADGIFSVERSLRATQHFDTLDVEKRRVGLSRLRKIGAIQVDRPARVGCQILVRLTDPANDLFLVIYLLGLVLRAVRDQLWPTCLTN